eukprot:49333-Alexandrium_andersonii.AAC.1
MPATSLAKHLSVLLGGGLALGWTMEASSASAVAGATAASACGSGAAASGVTVAGWNRVGPP